jgi:hypothetical protein
MLSHILGLFTYFIFLIEGMYYDLHIMMHVRFRLFEFVIFPPIHTF